MDFVNKYLVKLLQTSVNSDVVVGVSGGPDSMALLALLIDVRKIHHFNIICAHVNHKQRIESEEEEVFVKNFCKTNNVQFELLEINDYKSGNFHNFARKKRYNFFSSLIIKYDAKYLMTAHHGDDLVETMLMRIVRGSTLKGYAGFKKISIMDNFTIVRPLISVDKNTISDYISAHKIPFVVDESNKKDKYTRNRFRKSILPFLKEESEQVNGKFLDLSNKLFEYEDYVQLNLNKVFNKVYYNSEINILLFREQEHLIQKKIIEKIFKIVFKNNLELINNRHIDALFSLIASDKPNCKIDLPTNFEAIKEYDIISIAKNEDKLNSFNFKIKKLTKLPNQKTIEEVDNFETNNNNICLIDFNKIELPLSVRNKRNGDRIEIKGLGGSKKIKDIFIDSKISLSKRESWPILVDKKGRVIWIPGIKKSKYEASKDEKYDIILKYY